MLLRVSIIYVTSVFHRQTFNWNIFFSILIARNVFFTGFPGMYHVFSVLVLIHVYSVNNYLPEGEPMSMYLPLLQKSISGTAVLFTDYVLK